MHNYFVVHSGDKIEIDTSERSWKRFFDTFKATSCPTCTRERKAHCPHQAVYRNGGAQTTRARSRPSEMRDAMCARMWAEVCGDGRLNGEVVARMQERARVGFGGEECE